MFEICAFRAVKEGTEIKLNRNKVKLHKSTTLHTEERKEMRTE